MTEASLHGWLIVAVSVLAVASFVALRFVSAPYGRHVRSGWGPTIPDRLGWVLMESPAVLGFLAVYAVGDLRFEPVPLLLLGMWLLHYVHRTFVYPLRTRSAGKRMPVAIAAMAFSFNCLNAYLNARWISHLGPYADGAGFGVWLWAGVALFLAGWWLNLQSDRVLIHLRRPGETGYRIPRGGGFRWVSCPNYLGEIVEWLGFALASRSPAALAFAVFTIANLAPRALAHHRWYRDEFPDYPPERRALVPWLL